MDNIDLDTIINKYWTPGNMEMTHEEIKLAMKEAIHQFAVLVSEKAKVKQEWYGNTGSEEVDYVVDKQSILDCEKFIK